MAAPHSRNVGGVTRDAPPPSGFSFDPSQDSGLWSLERVLSEFTRVRCFTPASNPSASLVLTVPHACRRDPGLHRLRGDVYLRGLRTAAAAGRGRDRVRRLPHLRRGDLRALLHDGAGLPQLLVLPERSRMQLLFKSGGTV